VNDADLANGTANPSAPDDAALGALLAQTERPMPDGLRDRVRTFGEAHFQGGPEADAGPELLPDGTRIGLWVTERVLGSGGQAVVYLAQHRHLPGRRAAIKVPHGEGTRRMLVEGRALSRLQHPGIVDLLDIDPDAEPPYLALGYCPGGNLAERVEDEGPLPEYEAARIGCELLEALGYAHDRGVVHRDLKPQNVLFDADDRVRVADFGIGKVVAEQLSHSLTRATHTAFAGTPLYLAPEQERPGAKVDGRTDLYAFGKLLYHMLTGESPRTLRPIERERPEVETPRWSELIFQLTETDPDARPADARQALQQMRAIQGLVAQPAPVIPSLAPRRHEPAWAPAPPADADGLPSPDRPTAPTRRWSRSGAPAARELTTGVLAILGFAAIAVGIVAGSGAPAILGIALLVGAAVVPPGETQPEEDRRPWLSLRSSPGLRALSVTMGAAGPLLIAPGLIVGRPYLTWTGTVALGIAFVIWVLTERRTRRSA
jgi:hypothetical protein